jgi:lipid A 3-O-deacylase
MHTHSGRRALALGLMLLPFMPTAVTAAEPIVDNVGLTLEPAGNRSIWQAGIGEGFVAGAMSFEAKLSRGFGVSALGSEVAHDLWLVHAQLGYVPFDAWGEGRWYGGNLELTSQLMAGFQDRPQSAYFFALDVGARYHFATGGRLVPFIAGSIGVSATDIGGPDLSGVFQFNEQIGAGVRYFINDRQAIVLEYFLQHISNAGISYPNKGANTHFVSLGFAWLF